MTAAKFAGGSKKDGGELSPTEEVGHRFENEAKKKRVSFASDKYFSDLAVYQQHLRAKLRTTIQDIFDDKQSINFSVAVYVRYSNPRKGPHRHTANGPPQR